MIKVELIEPLELTYHVLDENKRVVVAPRHEWEIFVATQAAVAETRLREDVVIKTVFTGYDACFDAEDGEPPLLFETRSTFGPDRTNDGEYATWEEAIDGHRDRVVQVCRLLGMPEPALGRAVAADQ